MRGSVSCWMFKYLCINLLDLVGTAKEDIFVQPVHSRSSSAILIDQAVRDQVEGAYILCYILILFLCIIQYIRLAALMNEAVHDQTEAAYIYIYTHIYIYM